MKKIIFIIPLVFAIVIGTMIKPKAANINGYPPDLASWYSEHLYSDYYHMTTGNITLDNERKVISVFVPDFDNIITAVGQNTEQRIIFYDAFDDVISFESVFGRLVGWFNYTIPSNAYSFTYVVLVEGSLPSNYVAEWNDASYVGYGDLLDIYQKAWNEGRNYGYSEGYNDGYALGVADSYNIGYDDGYDYGLTVGHNIGYDDGYAVGYDDGLEADITTGGFITILSSAFIGVSTLLGIELLPNITIGMIVSVPLVFGILFFILGKRKD